MYNPGLTHLLDMYERAEKYDWISRRYAETFLDKLPLEVCCTKEAIYKHALQKIREYNNCNDADSIIINVICDLVLMGVTV